MRHRRIALGATIVVVTLREALAFTTEDVGMKLGDEVLKEDVAHLVQVGVLGVV